MMSLGDILREEAKKAVVTANETRHQTILEFIRPKLLEAARDGQTTLSVDVSGLTKYFEYKLGLKYADSVGLIQSILAEEGIKVTPESSENWLCFTWVYENKR